MTSHGAGGTQLGPASRARAIATMRQRELDVLIIGGGIVGMGAALDAATRGVRVGLIEARDFGAGTSSRSSKLVHGGIRYLERGDVALVREALTERGLLLKRLAPHLVRPVRFLYPIVTPVIERGYVGAGMMLYDALSWLRGNPGVPHHRHWSRRQIELAAPGINTKLIRGGISYYDGQVDDARYLVTLARTAANWGAELASRVSAIGLLHEAGRTVGVRARDELSGEEFEIRARQVISAAGVWTDEIERLADAESALSVRASKGIHIMVPKAAFASRTGLLLRTEKSVLFVIPWGRFWLIGTTDTPWHFDKSDPAASSADIDYVLERANAVMRPAISRDDIVGVFAGLRPLIAGASEETAKLSREHVVALPDPGLVVIAGGKWTTYRVMAEDVISAALGRLGIATPSVTRNTPLLGADGFHALRNQRALLASESGLSEAVIEHLLLRYGSLIRELLALITERPELAEELPGGAGYLAVEAVYAARCEGVVHLADVLERRLRLSIETKDRGAAAAPVVARLIAPELGWSPAERNAEVAGYLASLAAALDAEAQADDAAANAARVMAPSH